MALTQAATKIGTGGDLAKRVLDLVLAVVGITASLPIIAFLAVLVVLDSPGPPFYRRSMAGREAQPFWMLKLRTMVVDADRIIESDPALYSEWRQNHKLKNDPRITRLGYFLRKYSLDELPQFLNVLRGEMSVIGPRPLAPSGVEDFGEVKDIILSVRPGLTGLWQVSGRQETTLAQRIELDIWYIEHASVWLDLKILWRTVFEVLHGRGAY
jgi:lipopolysaccharide/colanic/teichoic acid biosynthesis glycosyltransferase